jgi:hypothetical protein
MLVFCKSLCKLLLNPNFVCICIRRVFIKIVKDIKVESRITNYSNNCKVLLLNHFVVLIQFGRCRSTSLSKSGICFKMGPQKL